MDVSVSQHLHAHRAATHLWRGMVLQAKGDLAAALTAYNASKRRAEPYDWQGAYRVVRTVFARSILAARARWAHFGTW